MNRMQQIIIENWIKEQLVIYKAEFVSCDKQYLIFLRSDMAIKLERKLGFQIDWFLIDNYHHFLKIKRHWSTSGVVSDINWYDDLAMGW